MLPSENVQSFRTPGFVGRRHPLRKLEAALDHVFRGETTIAVIAGEPGIGKTRLAQEIECRIRRREWLSLWGRSYENQPAAPYWPWQQIGRACISFVRTKHLPARQQEAASELEGLLSGPGPAGVVGSGGSRTPDGHTPDGADSADYVYDGRKINGGHSDLMAKGDYERVRFFDAFASLLTSVAETIPMLLVLDNIHCADQGSLQLLEFLSIELEQARVLVVATYRTVDLESDHPLHITLGELARRPCFLHVVLAGLEHSELTQLAQESLGGPPPLELVEALSRRTEGNPLYAIELVKLLCEQRHLRDEGAFTYNDSAVPETVTLAIKSRLARHSRGCVELLGTASMLGREFDLDALSRITGKPLSEELAASLREGIRAGFIEQIPQASSAYRFTHALIQEVLSAQLASPLSAAAHEHIGTKLEEYYGGTAVRHAATLAYHFSRSSSPRAGRKLARYAKEAGEEALNAHDYRRAAGLFQQALTTRDGEEQNEATADILFGLGRAHALDGNEEEAKHDLSAAFNLYADLGAVSKAVEVATFPLVFAYGYEVSFDLIERIMDRVTADSREWAWLETYSCVHDFRRQPEFAAADSRFRAVQTHALKHDDERLELHVLLAWCYVGYASMRRDEVLKKLPRIAELARRVGSLRTQVIAELFQISRTDERKEQRECTLTAFRIAERVRDRALLCMILSRVSGEYIEDGAWDAARAALDRAIAIYPHFTFGSVYARRARVEYETGHPEAGDTYLHLYLDAYRANEGRNVFEYAFLAELIARRTHITGRKDHASIATAITADILGSPGASPKNILMSLLWGGLLAAELGDRDGAASILARLEEMEHSHGIIGNESIVGLVAAGAGEYTLAQQYLEKAITVKRREGYRPDLAWCCCDYAEVLINQGKSGSGTLVRELLAEARSIAHELGMRPLEARIAALSGEDKEGTVGPEEKRLTAREREVLGQIALGKTNQEISRDLSISEHTVAHHASAIFGKIGVTNRVDAALYAARHGMGPG